MRGCRVTDGSMALGASGALSPVGLNNVAFLEPAVVPQAYTTLGAGTHLSNVFAEVAEAGDATLMNGYLRHAAHALWRHESSGPR